MNWLHDHFFYFAVMFALLASAICSTVETLHLLGLL